MYTALSIAGSDPSGGAGIQADLKTMTCNGVFAMAAMTSLTAQNTTGVSNIFPVTPEFIREQIEMVVHDIRPDAVKIGMVGSAPAIEAVALSLQKIPDVKTVVDPVMVSTSGSLLIDPDAIEALKTHLIQDATLITPNIPEAEVLCGFSIQNRDDMEKAARNLGSTFHTAVLVKGGHRVEDANDVLYDGSNLIWFEGERVQTENTHGTGCTLSSAIAANLAKGFNLPQSVRRAKAYITRALDDSLNLGSGPGPMNHAFKGHEDFFDLPENNPEV